MREAKKATHKVLTEGGKILKIYVIFPVIEFFWAENEVKFPKPLTEFEKDPTRPFISKFIEVTPPLVQVIPAQPTKQGSPLNQFVLYFQEGPFIVLYISVRALSSPIVTAAFELPAIQRR